MDSSRRRRARRPPRAGRSRRRAGDVHPPYGRGRGGPGGWWILIEPDVMLEPHQIVVPDLAGWKRERLPDLAAVKPIAVVPDWICEVVSPGDGGRDRVRKAAIYLRAGVALATSRSGPWRVRSITVQG